MTKKIHIRPGESIAIVGCGGLGLSAIQGARLSGAGKIIAVDLHEEKLEMARNFGATHTIKNNHDIEAGVAEVMGLTQGCDWRLAILESSEGKNHQPIKSRRQSVRQRLLRVVHLLSIYVSVTRRFNWHLSLGPPVPSPAPRFPS